MGAWDEKIAAARALNGKPPTDAPSVGEDNAFVGFAKSAASSVPELFGMDPSPSVEMFRREHPVLGLASELAGTSVPYLGWFKAAEKAPLIGKTIARLSTAEKWAEAPIRAAAAREAVRWIPFETARGISNVALGSESPLEATTQTAINTTIGAALGAVGGVLHAFAGSGRADPIVGQVFPEFNMAAPRQIQVRQLRDFETQRLSKVGTEAASTDEILGALRANRRRLELEIRQELAAKGSGGKKGIYLKDLVSGDTGLVNRLFYLHGDAPKAGTITRRPVTSTAPADFKDPNAWMERSLQFGLPDDWIGLTQYPRFTEFKSKEAARKYLQTVEKNLEPIGDGWFLGEEREGLYVMARRLEGGDLQGDRWVLFKTDMPSKFLGRQTKWADLLTRANAFEAGTISPKDRAVIKKLQVYGAMENFREQLPYDIARGVPRGKGDEFVSAVIQKAGIKELSEQASSVRKFIKQYLAPTQFQFSDNRLARYLHGVAKFTFDHAQASAERIMYGRQALSKEGSLFKEVWGSSPEAGGIKVKLDALSDTDLAQVWRSWMMQLSPEKAREELGLSKPAFDFLKTLQRFDRSLANQIQLTNRLVGSRDFVPLENHYMVSRTWKGDWRVPLYNEADHMVYMASGETKRAAWEEAQRVVADGAKSGQRLRIKDSEPFPSDRRTDMQWLQKLRVNSPGYQAGAQSTLRAALPKTFEERSGVGGYLGEKAPWKKGELEKILRDHVYQYYKYLAEKSVLHGLAPDLMKLSRENGFAYNQLVERLRDLSGRPGPLSRFQNQVVDRVLAPVLGKNSATRIVSIANTLTMNFQLGMGNLAFPALNAVTFLQTVLPHAAFVMGATPESVARYYTWFPVAGTRGPVGGMGVLDAWKLMRGSLKEMRRPDAALRADFERAAREGVWDPRLVEEYVGQGAKKAGSLKDVLSGEQGYGNWLRSVSEFLPGQSEKFARGHAFVLGRIIGRDVLHLADERLYHFAREFTNNTMYLYSTADRARLFTGPIGSLFGMFKNWQMHYIGQMLLYTDEALMKGNWAPLLWQTAGTASVGGLGALPLYGVANQMSQWLTNESLMLNTYQMFGGGEDGDSTLADGVFYGLPAFMGVSLAGSAEAPGSNFARDASMFFSFAQMDRMNYAARAIGAAFDHWAATGQHPAESPGVRDLLVRAFGPKTLYRTMQVIHDDALRSLSTGYPIASNLDMRQRFLFSLGLTPTEIDRSYAVSDELWQNQTKMREAISNFGKAFAEAQERGDGEGMGLVLRHARAQGVDVGSVLKSAATRRSKGREDLISRQFDRGAVRPYKEAGLVE